jgi:Zn-dependent peptidase ImmA (M78 family)
LRRCDDIQPVRGGGITPDRTDRRFEAARFLGDAILQPTDGWHLATAAGTARQKTQRSFASEFLAPIAGFKAQLQQDLSMEAIEDAAAYFNVSSYLIGSHLRNNGVIPYGHPAVPR